MDVCFVSTGNVILTATRSRRHSASCVCSLGPSSSLVAGASLFSWGSVLRSDSLPGPLLQGPAHRVEQVAYVDSKVATEDTVEPDVSRSKHTLSARDLVRWGIATKAIAGGTLTTIALSILGLYIIQDRLVYWPSSLNKGNPGVSCQPVLDRIENFVIGRGPISLPPLNAVHVSVRRVLFLLLNLCLPSPAKQ